MRLQSVLLHRQCSNGCQWFKHVWRREPQTSGSSPIHALRLPFTRLSITVRKVATCGKADTLLEVLSPALETFVTQNASIVNLWRCS
jgi:hypothetical protein